jgi:hypothetical protein
MWPDTDLPEVRHRLTRERFLAHGQPWDGMHTDSAVVDACY